MTDATAAKLAQVLFIEDSTAEIRLVTELLNRAHVQFDGHWVTTAEDALSFLRREKGFETAPSPDVIFLDLNLPKLSGGKLLQMIQSDRALSRIPVVILSGSDFEDDIVNAREQGATHYLVKPLDHPKLRETVALIDTLKLEQEGTDWYLRRV